jgi:hypothetical protein
LAPVVRTDRPSYRRSEVAGSAEREADGHDRRSSHLVGSTLLGERSRQAASPIYIPDDDPQGWQNSIEIVLRRFAELGDLERAFKRPTVTERAKGILMERHALDEAGAFQMLRDHARRMQGTLVDTAQSIVDGTLRIEKP